MSLSDKRQPDRELDSENVLFCYLEKDVREAVRALKEDLIQDTDNETIDFSYMMAEIDEIFGAELI